MPLYICSYVLQIVLQIVFHCFTVFTCLYLQKKVWLIVMASGAMAHLGTVAMLCAQAAEVKDQVEACPGPTFDHTRNNLKTTPTSEFEIFKKTLAESRRISKTTNSLAIQFIPSVQSALLSKIHDIAQVARLLRLLQKLEYGCGDFRLFGILVRMPRSQKRSPFLPATTLADHPVRPSQIWNFRAQSRCNQIN
jgi:hypothetical protein